MRCYPSRLVDIHLLLNLIPASLPISIELPLDWRVFGFTFLVAFVIGIVFGITPALRGTRTDPVQVIKAETHSGGYQKSRLRTVIMISEVAVCAMLLFSATLCVRSLSNASSIDPGFDTEHIAVATLDAGSLGYGDVKVEAFYPGIGYAHPCFARGIFHELRESSPP